MVPTAGAARFAETGIAFRLPRALSAAAGADRLWNVLSLGLFAASAGLILLTFRDYGVTWDEDVHNWYGIFVLNYYLSSFQDLHALRWLNLYNYGAAFDMVAAALNRYSPLGIYETRHLLNGAVGLFGLFGCWKLGRIMGGARVAFIATLFLLLTPNFYGQMFNNPKDIPFAVGAVWTAYYMARIVPRLPAPPARLLVKMGIAIGMAMGVRVGGLLLLCYLGLMLALYGSGQALAARHAYRDGSGSALRSARTLVVTGWHSFYRVFLPVLAVAYPVMLLFWPWAQIDPIRNPLRALAFFSHETFPFPTLFAGRLVPADDLPWEYLPTHIVLALPELILALALAAPVMAAYLGWRRRAKISAATGLPVFMLGFMIVFPVAYAIAIKAVLFDGMRHFIFLLPLIATAAALVADRALDRLGHSAIRRPAYAALALYGLAHLSIMAMLHPDQYVYYNALVGGVDGAQRNFKLDYWANSYAEAVRALEDRLRAEYGADFEEREFTVAVCGPPISADYFFPKNFRFTRKKDQAEFFIAFTKDDCHQSLPGPSLYKVERMGALLSVVIDRREILAQQRSGKRKLAGLNAARPAASSR